MAGVFWTYAGALVGIQAAGAVGGLAYVLVLVLRHPELRTNPKEWATALTGSPGFLIGALFVTEALLAAIALIAARWARTPASTRLRTGPSALPFWAVAAGALGTAAMGEALSAFVRLTGWKFTFTLDFLSKALASAGPFEFAVLVVATGVAAPVGEELFFRGFMQVRLVERWGPATGIAVTSALFGLFHLDPMQAPLAMLLGVYLGWIAHLGGSIRASAVAHAVNNTAAVLLARWLPHEVLPSAGVVFTGALGLSAACASALAAWGRRSGERARVGSLRAG